MIGLGRMGVNMVRRLMKGGHQCVVDDPKVDAVQALTKDPTLAEFTGRVSDSGEGRWTLLAAVEERSPAPGEVVMRECGLTVENVYSGLGPCYNDRRRMPLAIRRRWSSGKNESEGNSIRQDRTMW